MNTLIILPFIIFTVVADLQLGAPPLHLPALLLLSSVCALLYAFRPPPLPEAAPPAQRLLNAGLSLFLLTLLLILIFPQNAPTVDTLVNLSLHSLLYSIIASLWTAFRLGPDFPDTLSDPNNFLRRLLTTRRLLRAFTLQLSLLITLFWLLLNWKLGFEHSPHLGLSNLSRLPDYFLLFLAPKLLFWFISVAVIMATMLNHPLLRAVLNDAHQKILLAISLPASAQVLGMIYLIQTARSAPNRESFLLACLSVLIFWTLAQSLAELLTKLPFGNDSLKSAASTPAAVSISSPNADTMPHSIKTILFILAAIGPATLTYAAAGTLPAMLLYIILLILFLLLPRSRS